MRSKPRLRGTLRRTVEAGERPFLPPPADTKNGAVLVPPIVPWRPAADGVLASGYPFPIPPFPLSPPNRSPHAEFGLLLDVVYRGEALPLPIRLPPSAQGETVRPGAAGWRMPAPPWRGAAHGAEARAGVDTLVAGRVPERERGHDC